MKSKSQFKSNYRNRFVVLLLVAISLFQLGYFVFVRSGYHDFATFLIAKDLIADGQNPYEGNIFRNGFSLIYPLWIYAQFFGTFLGPGLWNLLNIAGLATFLHLLKPNMSWFTRGLILVILLFTSPARSMFANVQHTGIIIGLLSILYFLVSKPQSLKIDLLSAGLLFLAFELKPQTAIPMFFFLFFYRTRFRILAFWFAATAFVHLVMSLYFQKPLDVRWLNSLASISENSIVISAGDNSFWGIASYLFGFSSIWSALSYFVYATVLVVISSFRYLRVGARGQLITVLIAPLFLSYVHPYDFIVIALCVVLYIAEGVESPILKICLTLLLVPTVTASRNFPMYLIASLLIYAGFVVGLRIYGASRQSLKSETWPILGVVGYSMIFYIIGSEQLRVGILYAALLFLFIGWVLKDFRNRIFTSL
ncbi:hypothetical protein [Candidatus Planktophila dulcis]|uniref:hypothetical protein n=1 Tax=Candidatus Planktophila dulcis TaxID=1884914 RepID=UPI003CF82E23